MLTDSIVEIEDERKVKKIAFFPQEPLEEEDIDMVVEEDAERDYHSDHNETIMIDYAFEEEKYVVDFDGFF